MIRKDFRPEMDSLSEEERSEFISNGFIVADDIDETAVVRKAFMDHSRGNGIFRLTVNPTLDCNFRCWYCYERHNAECVMTADTRGRVKRLIDRLTQEYRAIELAFFGGEPLLEYDNAVKPLIEHLHQRATDAGIDYVVTFTTNGYLFSDTVISGLRKFRIGVSQITLDGTRDRHNRVRVSRKGDSFMTIVGNIKKMVRAGLPVLVRINLSKDNAVDAEDTACCFDDLTMKEKGLMRVLVQKVWQESDADLLDETWNIYESFLKSGIAPWPRHFNYTRDICYGDVHESAVVNHDGMVYKCTAIDFDRYEPDCEIGEDGAIDLAPGYRRRLEKRMGNGPCACCRILPVCSGGCCKNLDQAVAESEYCLHPEEEDKDAVVRNIIREQLHMSRLGLKWD